FWLHYFDPHRPYAPPENLLPAVEPPPFIGTAFTEFRKIRGGYFFPSLAEMEWIKTLYDAEVRHVDDNIGRLIDLLKQLGIYNESLIILTSDHGEEFWEHGGYEHGHTLYNELLWVPLIIKLPGSTTTGQIHSLVDITSITPTILEACHIEYDANYLSVPSLSACWDPRRQAAPGRPLVSTGLLYYEDRESVRLGAYKYIRSLVRGREELYNLDDDPAEWFSIVRSSPEKVGQAKKILNEERARAQYLREHYGIVSSEGAILDEETLEKLRSLGYID
ncbi:MAG: sulfatase-like hydrolase/transferase, partial [Candidatus Eisenbacteria sp.]|nr:sulfatase-like hydrolase/transferase [Candidatus Eisenbacteria bacterium]